MTVLGALEIEMDRRRFLALLGSLMAAGTLAACGSPLPSSTPSTAASTPGPSPDSDPRYDVLRSLRSIIRSSPDHLGTIAAAAVATGDPGAIALFVRDQIAVLPGTSAGSDAATDVRWGHRGALRAGAGTLRERADLVADLLHQAGIDNRIVTIARPASYRQTARTVPAFAPDRAAIGSLWDPIAPTHPPVGATPDTAGSRADTAAARLLAALPSELVNARLVAPAIPDTVPAVEFTRDGVTRWAVALGDEPVLASTPDGALAAADAVVPRVSVAVSVAVNPPTGATIDRTVLHEVLRGEWGADELAGRRLALAFATPGSPSDALARDHTTAPIRVPILRLVSGDALGDTTAVVTGTCLSTAGGLVEPSADNPGQVVGPLGPMNAPGAAGSRGPLVATLEGSALAASYPEIELRLQALQADGSPAIGLASGDFQVAEGGQPRAVTVIANARPAVVRVLVVYDTSGSVTDFWGSPARRSAFEATLAATLGDAARANPFQVQVIGVGDSATEDGWAAPDPSTLAAAFGAVASNSDVWLTLGRSVPASGAAVALLVSDNEAHDLPDDIPALRRAVRGSGIPVACLPVGTVDEVTTGLIVADSGGTRFDIAAPDLATGLATFIDDHVASAATTDYRLRYQAAATGPSERTVTVGIAGSAAPALALTYTVPDVPDRAVPPGIAGIYLTVRVGDHESRRRLGGVRVSARDVPGDTADGPAIADATEALNGLHTIGFEPAFATTAHLLDDVIGAALSAEPVEKAWAAGPAAIIAAGADWNRMPAAMAWLAEAVPDGTPAAVPDGLRVTVLSDRFGAGGFVQLSDVVPGLNRAVGAGPDGAAAFRAALRATIGASLRESEVYGTSAAGQLGGADLVVVPASASAEVVTTWSDEQRARLSPMIDEYPDYHRLVPAGGDVAAMWVVDPDTGSVTAVDGEGRGGGTLLPDCLTPADANEASAFITVSISLISAACLAIGGDPSFGCVGADVFGAVSAGLAVFTAAPDIPASAFGAASYGAGLAAANVESAAGRTIIAVLLLIAGLLSGGKC